MAKTQSYIGIRNGVVVCINSYNGYDMSGQFYHGYSEDPVEFMTGTELLFGMEQLFRILNFPHAVTNERTFDEHTEKRTGYTEEREKVMSDKEMLNKHGDAGTFIIRVQQKQNSSWQGRITWVDEDKTVYFRSVWEMMKLIDSALDDGTEDEEKTVWK